MDKKSWLDKLHYDFDKQRGNLEVAQAFLDKEKNPKWSKWKKYLEAQGDEKFLSKVNNRTILPNEVVLDIEDTEKFSEIHEKVKKDFKFYSVYKTGSRGYHIHLWFDQDLTNEEKGAVIEEYKTDKQKAGKKCLIALENCPHWKTGNLKTILEENSGFNDLSFVKGLKQERDLEKDEEGIKAKLSNFILDDKQIPQRIDHAVGVIEINNQKYRYYGAKLNEKVMKKSKGKLVTYIEKVNAIVLENGEIISENTKPDDLSFEFDSVMTLKRNRWSLDLINKFCRGECKKEDYTFNKIFEKFKACYDDGMVFDLEDWYLFNPLWDMTTYFWDIIDKFLIPKHEGISGSAKSKGLKISCNLSFNGKKFLCPTPANFFRYRHHNKATICIEEAERLFDDSKKKSVGDSELVEYLTGSYEKGNTVPRQNDKNINQTDEFDPAGFSRIGSIKPLKGALEKRSIPLQMIKASKTDKRGNIEIPAENDSEYTAVRGMAYICGLFYYKDFMNALADVKNNYDLANRQWIVAKPIIAMARCVNVDFEKKVGDFIVKLFTIRDDSLDENSWEIVLSKTLVKLFSTFEGEEFISTEAIKEKFVSELSPSDYKVNNIRIGILMRSLGFSDFKANPSGNQRGYRITFFKLCEILLRQEWMKIENIKKIVSEVSERKITDDKINKWYTDTFLTPDISKKKTSDTLTDMTLVCGKEIIDFSKTGIKEFLEKQNAEAQDG